VTALSSANRERERLMTTLALATALHGIIVMGVTFGVNTGGSITPTLEVLLVNEDLPESAANANARYLAQRTQRGAGNARSGETSTPERRPLQQPRTAAAADAGSEVVSTITPQPDIIYASPAAPAVEVFADEQPVAPGREPSPGRGTREELHLLGDAATGQWLSADTRASDLAPYLDRWRRRVERLGSLNYPAAARAGRGRAPVIEVSLADDGRLQSAVIQRSSGDAALDQAALQILRLASPFGAFPPDLAQRYRSLRFAYQWEFSVTSGTEATSSP
jgi:protein TonB